MITTLLTVIAPYATPIDSLFFTLVFFAIISATLALLLFTSKILAKNRNRGLLGMLTGFIALVSLCAVIFTWVHAKSIQPIVFEQESLSIGANRIQYKKIDKSYIKPLVQKSRYSAELNTDTALIYVILMRDGKSYLLSNENYDLKAVKTALDDKLK